MVGEGGDNQWGANIPHRPNNLVPRISLTDHTPQAEFRFCRKSDISDTFRLSEVQNEAVKIVSAGIKIIILHY
jgi:hypothetical protein